jgi:hypothetical protein
MPLLALIAALSWAVPQGWRTETIPFPLEFAPELKHRGGLAGSFHCP